MNQSPNPLQPTNPQPASTGGFAQPYIAPQQQTQQTASTPVQPVQQQTPVNPALNEHSNLVQPAPMQAAVTQPVMPNAALQPAQRTIQPHRVPSMPLEEHHVSAGPTIKRMEKDRSFYAAVIVFLCLIAALSGYIFLAISTKSNNSTNTASNTPVVNVPVSDTTDLPKFVEKAFELNKKVIWRVTYPETFFANESEIDTGKVTLSGEYLDNNIKVIMSFPTFKDYEAGAPFYFSDWLKAEKAFADPAAEALIRTELTTIQGLEAAIVYNYPEIIQDDPERILGTSNSVVVYIWKNENNNPRRIEFKMDNYSESFLAQFVEDFINELEFQ